ncbi:MAG: TIM barrel protein [Pelistega sp.]|nr:TIM barrel protein [Pelistega sp.]
MLKFAANLSMLYTEWLFIERFAQAAQDGFKGVECLFPYVEPAQRLKAELQAYDLQQVLFNTPAGDWVAGERGLACLPGRQIECLDGVKKALDYALVLGTQHIHLMAGIPADDVEFELLQAQYLDTVAKAADLAAGAGVTILLEPINPLNMPGYFLRTQAQAHQVVDLLQRENIKVQMDLFHCQRTEGNVATKLAEYLPSGCVGHIQIAGAPERHEPDTGELNYVYIFEQLLQLDYQGWIACEYNPQGHTREGLGWLQAWRQREQQLLAPQ